VGKIAFQPTFLHFLPDLHAYADGYAHLCAASLPDAKNGQILPFHPGFFPFSIQLDYV
jgi:hypothetical protein